MKEKTTSWFGMRLTVSEKEKIRRLAQRTGLSAKDTILHLVNRELGDSGQRAGTFLQGLDHLIVSSTLPGDLHTRPDEMDGFGKDVCAP